MEINGWWEQLPQLGTREGSHQEETFKQKTKRQKRLSEVLLIKDEKENVEIGIGDRDWNHNV